MTFTYSHTSIDYIIGTYMHTIPVEGVEQLLRGGLTGMSIEVCLFKITTAA